MAALILAVLLFAGAASALPVCGPADGHFRVYQIKVKDLETAKGGLSKTFAFARSHRTSISCEVYGREENLGRADQRHAETRWIPKQGRAMFELELATLGQVRISDHPGAEPTPPPPGELKRLKTLAATERDPAKKKLIAVHITRQEDWEYSYRITGTMDLIHVRLLWREKDQPPYTAPPPKSLKVTPKTVRLVPSPVGVEELRRSVDWFKKN